MKTNKGGFKNLAIGSAIGFAAGFAVAATHTGVDQTTIIERLPNGEERLVSTHWEIPPVENAMRQISGLADYLVDQASAPFTNPE